ncbi:MAG: metal-dependent hydrolase [Thermoleophilaceae bacterium]|nr:metal-dependent hydrolase [Thermoleophilaceae bacterium]
MEIRFLGHSCFELTEGSTRVLIDPFLSENPLAAAAPADLDPTHLFLTHGHFDHLGDTVDIAKRSGAFCVASKELAGELTEDGIENIADPLLGGTVEFEGGWVRLVPAWHFGVTPKGTVHAATGLVIKLGETVVYHLGDTALFSDLQLVGRRDEIDVAIVCIGGHYTMDRHDALTAAELVGAKQVIPCHYDTFPPIETDANAFKSDVEAQTSSQVVVLEPGGTHSV